MKALYFMTLTKQQLWGLEQYRDSVIKKKRAKLIQHLNYAAYCAIAMQIANRYAWLVAVEIGMPGSSEPLVRTHACVMSVACFLNYCLVDKAKLFVETNLNPFQKLVSLANSVPNFDQNQCENEFKGQVFKYLKDASTLVYPQYNSV